MEKVYRGDFPRGEGRELKEKGFVAEKEGGEKEKAEEAGGKRDEGEINTWAEAEAPEKPVFACTTLL